ncbi:MAG TPA: hypothetical protein VEB68_03395 [Croceibacterium sp.]|nr:hypothetical protein [Croceibacterium sp.]
MAHDRPVLAFLAALALASPGSARAQPAPAAPPPDPLADGEILVLGPNRLDELPVQAQSVAPLGRVSRSLGSESARFVRCADLPEAEDLRAILDHGPGHHRAQRALHKFIVRNEACYGGYGWPTPESPYFGTCNPQIGRMVTVEVREEVCRSTYDRGALYERALADYGASLELTRAQTFDPAVRARFSALDQQRDNVRPRIDRDYFVTVACMVQIAPQVGRDLLAAEPGSTGETTARRLLIGNGGPCVGGAKRVTADPVQFRAYTAEAVYAWLTAAAGRTLVPG